MSKTFISTPGVATRGGRGRARGGAAYQPNLVNNPGHSGFAARPNGPNLNKAKVKPETSHSQDSRPSRRTSISNTGSRSVNNNIRSSNMWTEDDDIDPTPRAKVSDRPIVRPTGPGSTNVSKPTAELDTTSRSTDTVSRPADDSSRNAQDRMQRW
jgi:hypothetical protein